MMSRPYLKQVVEQVENAPLITVHKGTTVEKTDGFVGNFKTNLANEQRLITEPFLLPPVEGI